MALSAVLDLDAVPPTLAVTSNIRPVEVDVTVANETVHASGLFPVRVQDTDHVWTLDNDDGVTAVYTLST